MATPKITLPQMQELAFDFTLEAILLHKSLTKKGHTVLADGMLKSVTELGLLANSIDENTNSKTLFNYATKAISQVKEVHFWFRLLEKSELLTKKWQKRLEITLQHIEELLEGKAKKAKADSKVGF